MGLVEQQSMNSSLTAPEERDWGARGSQVWKQTKSPRKVLLHSVHNVHVWKDRGQLAEKLTLLPQTPRKINSRPR